MKLDNMGIFQSKLFSFMDRLPPEEWKKVPDEAKKFILNIIIPEIEIQNKEKR